MLLLQTFLLLSNFHISNKWISKSKAHNIDNSIKKLNESVKNILIFNIYLSIYRGLLSIKKVFVTYTYKILKDNGYHPLREDGRLLASFDYQQTHV